MTKTRNAAPVSAALRAAKLPAIGKLWKSEGGIVLGCYVHDGEVRALLTPPRKELERPTMAWSASMAMVKGAGSLYDGLPNTKAMLRTGSAAAKWAMDLRIGGKSDWCLPARSQALVAFAADLRGTEAFDKEAHWTSTQYAFDERWAWYQYFDYGIQSLNRKDSQLRLFAVRSLIL